MLPFGAWIPQSVARSAGGGELLLGVNYNAAMAALRIRYENWGGAGGAKAWLAWAKARLTRGVGVISVAYVKGLADPDYDHIMAVLGVDTTTPAGGFDAGDAFYFATGYDAAPVRRGAGGYACTRTSSSYTINQAGCVPTNTQWGTAVLGPAYANATRPGVSLTALSSLSEPGVGKPGVTMTATLTLKGLVVGRRYKIFKVVNLARVPTTPGAVPAPADLASTFTATATTRTTSVSFLSSSVAYFICVPA